MKEFRKPKNAREKTNMQCVRLRWRQVQGFPGVSPSGR